MIVLYENKSSFQDISPLSKLRLQVNHFAVLMNHQRHIQSLYCYRVNSVKCSFGKSHPMYIFIVLMNSSD